MVDIPSAAHVRGGLRAHLQGGGEPQLVVVGEGLGSILLAGSGNAAAAVHGLVGRGTLASGLAGGGVIGGVLAVLIVARHVGGCGFHLEGTAQGRCLQAHAHSRKHAGIGVGGMAFHHLGHGIVAGAGGLARLGGELLGDRGGVVAVQPPSGGLRQGILSALLVLGDVDALGRGRKAVGVGHVGHERRLAGGERLLAVKLVVVHRGAGGFGVAAHVADEAVAHHAVHRFTASSGAAAEVVVLGQRAQVHHVVVVATCAIAEVAHVGERAVRHILVGVLQMPAVPGEVLLVVELVGELRAVEPIVGGAAEVGDVVGALVDAPVPMGGIARLGAVQAGVGHPGAVGVQIRSAATAMGEALPVGW